MRNVQSLFIGFYATLSLLCAACATPEVDLAAACEVNDDKYSDFKPSTGSLHYWISDAFTDEEAAKIRAGAETWAPFVDVRYLGRSPTFNAAMAETSVYVNKCAAFKPGVLGYTRAYQHVVSLKSAALRPGVVAHEFGHALGLEHARAVSSIMYPICSTDPAAAPDAGDVAALRILQQAEAVFLGELLGFLPVRPYPA